MFFDSLDEGTVGLANVGSRTVFTGDGVDSITDGVGGCRGFGLCQYVAKCR